MTRLPSDDRLVVDRADLPPYELNTACPVTGEMFNLERHHLWPRRYTYGWWTELRTGEVVGNIVALSSKAHERITTNRARIVYEDGLFWWEEVGEKTLLKWQPPKWIDGKASPSVNVTVEDVPAFTPHTASGHPLTEGETCPTCSRRIPHKKKKSSPRTKVFSTRVPIGDVDTFNELVDAAAEHAGLKSKPHHVYNALLVGLTLILQSPKEHLP